MFKTIIRLVAGLTGVATAYVFVAGVLHAAFGWNFMLRIGRGTSWIELPQDTAGIFFVFGALLIFFLIVWVIACWKTAVEWMRSHKVLTTIAVLLICTGIGTMFFLVQESDNSDIFLAVQEERTEVVQKLLATGVDINMRDMEGGGTTVLIGSASSGTAQMVEFLLKNGANPNIKNDYGHTPLMAAVLYRETGDEDIAAVVRLLLAAGAEKNVIEPISGKTLREVAQEKGYNAVATLLQ